MLSDKWFSTATGCKSLFWKVKYVLGLSLSVREDKGKDNMGDQEKVNKVSEFKAEETEVPYFSYNNIETRLKPRQFKSKIQYGFPVKSHSSCI